MDRSRRRRMAAEAGYWLLVYAALWALFAEARGWLLGVPSVLVATGVSLWLGLQPVRLRWRALPGFVGFFVANMASGAWDVARRAVHPQRPVAPAWVDYRLHGGDRRVALMLSALVGLLPGTLSSQVDGRTMRLHVLDTEQDWRRTVEALERHLARLFGVEAGA